MAFGSVAATLVAVNIPNIVIPADLLPADGRFGSGPTKVRPQAVQSLLDRACDYLGTSHRQATVRSVVADLRRGLAELLRAPDGYEIILGNGGSTVFWDCATFSLINRRSHHLCFGEFGSKFAKAVAMAPHLEAPSIAESAMGTHPPLETINGAADIDGATDIDGVAGISESAGSTGSQRVDAYCYPHNETSTGVVLEPVRVGGPGDLMIVDATSGAGAVMFDPRATDVYYFAPQKALASDGGVWMAMLSPAAIERIETIASSGRWIPPTLNLAQAVANSRKDQTYNTPALATVLLTLETVNWFNNNGGLAWSAGRSRANAEILYGWAEEVDFAEPFVADKAQRSPTVATIDFDDSLNADTVSDVLRSNGIIDTNGYRKLGRNQLRIGMFPAIDPADTEALTRCLDYVVAAL